MTIRRGRYRRRDETQPIGRIALPSSEWSPEDHQHYEDLRKASPLAIPAAKDGLARRAVELSRACRALDDRVRTSEEDRAITSASAQYRKTLEALQITDLVVDEDADL